MIGGSAVVSRDSAGTFGKSPVVEQTIVRNSAGTYRLFRIGDAVASRNAHAAILDAKRLCQAI